MKSFDIIEREQFIRRGPNLYKCKCGCEYFEQIVGNKFSSDQTVVIGQPLNPLGQPFYFVRCIKCGESYTPNVIITSQDSITTEYNSMLDQMDTPLPAKQEELPLVTKTVEVPTKVEKSKK